VNGSRPPGLLPVDVVGGAVSKVTPSTVGAADGLDVGLPPPAGQAALLGLVVANPCAAIPALNTSTTIARRLGISECVRVGGVSTHNPGRHSRRR
jgi:hypothetical protein